MRSSAKIEFGLRVSPRELPELMDGDCSYEDFRGCLRSLEQINRWLLGYRPTLAWLKRLPPALRNQGLRAPVHIVDVGCGGGDLLRQIAGWARKRSIAVRLTGIDLNPYAARAAAECTPKELGIAWVTGNALVYRPEKPVDIIVSSLMAHHLEYEEIVALLRWMEASAQAGWFINDLERSERNSRMFGWLNRTTGWHRFVRHDGPVSFRRAFRKEDWLRLLTAAEVPQEAVTVEHWRPGRLCVGRWKCDAGACSGPYAAQLASHKTDR
jgi:SAM-dependent methyltransferase